MYYGCLFLKKKLALIKWDEPREKEPGHEWLKSHVGGEGGVLIHSPPPLTHPSPSRPLPLLPSRPSPLPLLSLPWREGGGDVSGAPWRIRGPPRFSVDPRSGGGGGGVSGERIR